MANESTSSEGRHVSLRDHRPTKLDTNTEPRSGGQRLRWHREAHLKRWMVAIPVPRLERVVPPGSIGPAWVGCSEVCVVSADEPPSSPEKEW